MATYIPNLNTLSTLLDRLSIENVKLAHFENAIEHDNLDATKRREFEGKVEVQKEIIGSLKVELIAFFEDVFTTGKYEYIKEARTFV